MRIATPPIRRLRRRRADSAGKSSSRRQPDRQSTAIFGDVRHRRRQGRPVVGVVIFTWNILHRIAELLQVPHLNQLRIRPLSSQTDLGSRPNPLDERRCARRAIRRQEKVAIGRRQRVVKPLFQLDELFLGRRRQSEPSTLPNLAGKLSSVLSHSSLQRRRNSRHRGASSLQISQIGNRRTADSRRLPFGLHGKLVACPTEDRRP